MIQQKEMDSSNKLFDQQNSSDIPYTQLYYEISMDCSSYTDIYLWPEELSKVAHSSYCTDKATIYISIYSGDYAIYICNNDNLEAQ